MDVERIKAENPGLKDAVFQTPRADRPPLLEVQLGDMFSRSVSGILLTFWVMGFLIYEQKDPFFFLGEQG